MKLHRATVLRRSWRAWSSLLAGALALLGVAPSLLACNQEPTESGPTEPWRAGTRLSAEKTGEIQTTRYELERSQLSFEIGGKRTEITGSLPRAGGFVELDPRALERTSGKISFDLQALRVESTSGDYGSSLATREALRWLGLGQSVPRQELRGTRHASFQIESAKLLSHTMAYRGAVVSPQDVGLPADAQLAVRRVRGTVQGELMIRSLAVQHRLRVDVDFVFPQEIAPDSVPERIIVKLVSSERVPLVEHDIAPRDQAGRRRAEASDLVGSEVASAARVQGQLELRRAGD